MSLVVERETDHAVDPLFAARWSPRSFTGETIPDRVLSQAFEAARWAPSAFNLQPWRFVIARAGDAHWNDFLDLLVPRNRKWAVRASALIVILSQTEAEIRGQRAPIASHSLDTGAAWSNLIHQLLLLGWHSHGIGGFERDKARALLGIPDDHAIEAMAAIGRRGPLADLDPEFHDAEKPNGRRSLEETVFAGRFGTPAFSNQGSLA